MQRADRRVPHNSGRSLHGKLHAADGSVSRRSGSHFLRDNSVTDHETITVAFAYAALALVGPFVLARLIRWAESDDAANLATEIGYAIEGVVR